MKILVSDPMAEKAIQEMEEAGLDVTVKPGLKPEALKEIIPPFDVIAVRSGTKVTADLIRAARNLKLIVRAGVGLDNVDCNAAEERKIEIQNTPNATTVTVAEHTFALMLSLARNIPQAYLSLKNGEWNRNAFQGVELKEKILAVIGLGRIGQEVAKRAKAFGMLVMANDQEEDKEIAEALEIAHYPLEEILPKADFVTLHLPLTEESRHLFNREKLLTMKKGSRLINASRGGIVDEAALYEVLASGHLAGAAIDVFEVEPPKDNPLLKLPQVVAVPHLGALTKAGQLRAGHEAARIIIDFAKNHG